ncbi:carboxymuconolactone decarboxylase family protein [Jatrophihabitans fulvus]
MNSKYELPGALWAHDPDSAAALTAVNARVWRTFDPALLALVHDGVARIVAGGRESAVPDDAVQGRVLELAEQLALDVGGLTPAQLAELADDFAGDRLADLVRALFAVEFTLRLRTVAGALLEPVVAAPTPAADPGGTLKDLLGAFQNAVVRGDVLDPVTTELVRLRCARTHGCRICQTLRLESAREAGADDAMTAKIDRYESSDLPERAKTALRITDAFITGTGAPPAALVGQARRTFSQRELAALCFDIPKWSTQKIHVALGTDGAERLPVGPNGVALFGFDADGRPAGFSPA